MIIGVGIDMIEVDRVMEKISKNNGFKEKVFSQREIAFCEANRKEENYAARFAAKEAFLKATGLGLLLGNDLSKIEIVNDVNGKPSINLDGNFKKEAEQNSWNKIHLSLSHLQQVACAVVIIEQ
ncbi:holo-ACP synthase [Chryseolinea sp. H1M3-3]|uniref:holo-ACP synthase n=1 Tax=Chryseolinea sp. H1M3-3 TaxID=3034144 RepID=UPI0023ECCCDC|nr:holo-ACP synthase [Chryseolinea sp. H1M3-3]